MTKRMPSTISKSVFLWSLFFTLLWSSNLFATVPTVVDDNFSSVPITSSQGGVAGDATSNDSLDGILSNPDANTTLSILNDGGSGAIIDANGNIHVPQGTPVGTYQIVYQSCDISVRDDCANGTVTITVHDDPFAGQQCTVVDETVNVGMCGDWDNVPAGRNAFPVTPPGPDCSTWNRVSFTPDIVPPIDGLPNHSGTAYNYQGVVASPQGGNYLGMAADHGDNEAVSVDLHDLIPGETYRISFYYVNSGRAANERDPVFVRIYMPGMTLPIGTPVLNYDPNNWYPFNTTFVATSTTGTVIFGADNTAPLDESGVGVDAIRVTRVRCVMATHAQDDTATGVPGSPVTVFVLNNDIDPDNDIDPSTVNIVTPGATDSDNDGDNDVLIVQGEGTWQVDNTSGAITFTPDRAFLGNPTPIQYNLRDRTGLVSNTATVTIIYTTTTVPTLSVWAQMMLAVSLVFVGYYLGIRKKDCL